MQLVARRKIGKIGTKTGFRHVFFGKARLCLFKAFLEGADLAVTNKTFGLLSATPEKMVLSLIPSSFFVLLRQAAEEAQRKAGLQSTVFEANVAAAEERGRLDGAGQMVVRRLLLMFLSVLGLPPVDLKISIAS